MATETNTTKFKDALKALIKEGESLWFSMALELDLLDQETAEDIRKLKLISFEKRYEPWYSVAMQVIKQVLPDRLADFIKQYKDEKRKLTDVQTYGIYDYMIGLEIGDIFNKVVDKKAAFPKFEQQLNILKSAEARFENSLFDIREVIQADLFDNELDAATELAKKGHLRGAGAVAGVVLEGHLGQVCAKHNLKTRKNGSINVYNQMLKDGGVIDTPMWRFIQHLGDLRNLCDHSKDREPTNNEVNDLLSGVAKVIKTLF